MVLMVLMVLRILVHAPHVQGMWWIQGLSVLACARELFQRARSARSALRINIFHASSFFSLRNRVAILSIPFRLAGASQLVLLLVCVVCVFFS